MVRDPFPGRRPTGSRPGTRTRRAGRTSTGWRLNGRGSTTGPDRTVPAAGPCGASWERSQVTSTSLARPSIFAGDRFEREVEEGGPEGRGAADGRPPRSTAKCPATVPAAARARLRSRSGWSRPDRRRWAGRSLHGRGSNRPTFRPPGPVVDLVVAGLVMLRIRDSSSGD